MRDNIYIAPETDPVQVQIFGSGDGGDLQQSVNNWLKRNCKVDVINIIATEAASAHHRHRTMYIFYRANGNKVTYS